MKSKEALCIDCEVKAEKDRSANCKNCKFVRRFLKEHPKGASAKDCKLEEEKFAQMTVTPVGKLTSQVVGKLTSAVTGKKIGVKRS